MSKITKIIHKFKEKRWVSPNEEVFLYELFKEEQPLDNFLNMIFDDKITDYFKKLNYGQTHITVSYTHLTLPTKRIV